MRKGTFDKLKTKRCIHCETKFENVSGSIFANHVKWCKKNPNRKKFEKQTKIASSASNLKRYGELKEFDVICHFCKKPLKVTEREFSFPKKERYFCNRSCSARYAVSKVDYKSESFLTALSEGVSDKWKNDPEYSKKCLSTNPRFTSNGERDLRDWFIQSFPNEGWTFGGALKFESIKGIVRDLYSDILKICIEYDGEWHFKDLVGQLESKQLKDQALENWCLKNGYRLIRIKDEIYQENPEKWKNKIRSEVLNGTESIVKFY